MELEFLGTGAGVPAKNRNVTSIALKLLDERNEIWLFDAGEGTQHQILETTLKPRKISKIFITHLHGDHIFGLPGLLSSRSFQGGETPLTIYGPKGIEEYVRTSLRISDSHVSYPIRYVTLTQPGTILDDHGFKVSFDRLDHRVESFGFRIVEKPHAGELLVNKLRAEQVPSGPIYGRIKAGETVRLPDGRQINGQDYIGPSQPGRIVTILGDTRKTANSLHLAANANVLVHESTFGAAEAKLAHQYYHSTSLEAAEIAKNAGVKQLLITHISARYLGRAAQELETQARTVFNNTRLVSDFDQIDVPFIKEADELVKNQ